jgi:hypothetical protein
MGKWQLQFITGIEFRGPILVVKKPWTRPTKLRKIFITLRTVYHRLLEVKKAGGQIFRRDKDFVVHCHVADEFQYLLMQITMWHKNFFSRHCTDLNEVKFSDIKLKIYWETYILSLPSKIHNSIICIFFFNSFSLCAHNYVISI